MNRLNIAMGLTISLLAAAAAGCADGAGQPAESTDSLGQALQEDTITLDGGIIEPDFEPDAGEVIEDDLDGEGRSATGGWKGRPVGVRIHVVGRGLHVAHVWAEERWNVGPTIGRAYGHTEIYSQRRGTIINNQNHIVRPDFSGAQRTNAWPNRNFDHGDKICARWWEYYNGQYHQAGGDSCVNIKR